MPTFQSALLKIQRAESQANNLGREIKGFFESSNDRAYGITFERNVDPREWRAIFRILKQMPDEWPVLLGEIIHNLRSALDHLVYEASAPDENGVPLRGTEYPIYIDKSEYLKRGIGPRKIRGLNDATRAFVEKYQPFTNRDPKGVSYLWLLHQLSNTDKHRLLNVIVRAHPLTRVELLIKPTKTPLTSKHIRTRISVPKDVLEDGAEYFTFATPEPLPDDVQMDMETKFAIEILFGDATPDARGFPVWKTIQAIGQLVGAFRNEFVKRNPDPA